MRCSTASRWKRDKTFDVRPLDRTPTLEWCSLHFSVVPRFPRAFRVKPLVAMRKNGELRAGRPRSPRNSEPLRVILTHGCLEAHHLE